MMRFTIAFPTFDRGFGCHLDSHWLRWRASVLGTYGMHNVVLIMISACRIALVVFDHHATIMGRGCEYRHLSLPPQGSPMEPMEPMEPIGSLHSPMEHVGSLRTLSDNTPTHMRGAAGMSDGCSKADRICFRLRCARVRRSGTTSHPSPNPKRPSTITARRPRE